MNIDTVRSAVIASKELNFDEVWAMSLASNINQALIKLKLPPISSFLKPIIKSSFMAGVENGIVGCLEYLIAEQEEVGRV